jgi:hypothetical protein
MKMRLIALVAAALLATACTKSAPPAAAGAAPAPTNAEATAAADADANLPDAAADPGPPLPPPPLSTDAGATGGDAAAAVPRPSIAVGEPNPGAPGVVDASCRTDADCAIKDVGSCCGYRPQCVNTASPTFPEQVQAACAKSGRMGICGFPAITGCTCKAGQCEGTGADAGNQVQ